jgi:hypothetical protein
MTKSALVLVLYLCALLAGCAAPFGQMDRQVLPNACVIPPFDFCH